MKRLIAISVVPVALAFAAAPAAADSPRPEIGVFLGGHWFSKTSELGTVDLDAAPTLAAGFMIGLRAGIPLPVAHHRFVVEGEAIFIPTHDTTFSDGDTVFDLRLQLRFDILTRGKLRPFVLAGFGMQTISPKTEDITADTDAEFHAGLGVAYRLNRNLDVRVDGRDLIVPSRTKNGVTSDYELMVGVTWRFGHEAEPVPSQTTTAPPPAADPAAAPQ